MAVLDNPTGRRTGSDRFASPLYTVAEAARYLDVPPSTLATWAHGYVRQPPGRAEVHGAPILTALETPIAGSATIPFVGLAEGLVLAGIRKAGVPMQRIRPALDWLRSELGLEHVLASRKLFTDGAEVLYDFAESQGDTPEGQTARQLVVVRRGQHVFAEVIDAYLKRVEFDVDDYARLIRLPGYTAAEVVADPSRGFGQPIFVHGGARVEDVLGTFQAGVPLKAVAAEYGVPESELEDALRVATRLPG
jgi:uncharacterized protein (DUF433 family)